MNRKRKNMWIIIATLVIIVGTITLAYAALSATLNVGFGDITQTSLTWNVGFQGSTASAITSGTSATGNTCGEASITPNTVSVATTTLSKPGDKCTYELNIKNSGDIAATLSSITPTRPSGATCSTSTGTTMECGNITYKLTSDSTGTTEVPTSTTLAAGATNKVYLVASYTGTELSSSAATQSGAKFTLNYIQA